MCSHSFTALHHNTDAHVAVFSRLCPTFVSASFPPVKAHHSDSPAGEIPRIEISVNGETKRISAGSTVGELLALLGIDRARVAVERNQDVVTKKSYDQVVIAAGDRLEIVSFVGGG